MDIKQMIISAVQGEAISEQSALRLEEAIAEIVTRNLRIQKAKPFVEKCEHEYELNKNGLSVCIKCGSCPALPKNWGKVKMPSGELVDFSAKRKKHEFECDECGIIHGHSAECNSRPDKIITIRRKVAEDFINDNRSIYGSIALIEELKLALSKEGK